MPNLTNEEFEKVVKHHNKHGFQYFISQENPLPNNKDYKVVFDKLQAAVFEYMDFVSDNDTSEFLL